MMHVQLTHAHPVPREDAMTLQSPNRAANLIATP